MVETCRQSNWIENKEMTIFGGLAYKLTLDDCMDKCARRSSCIAVSYNHHERVKKNCWLHVPEMGIGMVPVKNIGHPILKRLYTIKDNTRCRGNFIFTVIDNKSLSSSFNSHTLNKTAVPEQTVH